VAGLVRNHIKPTLGPVKLKDLSPANLRGMYRAKLDSGLSGRTVAYVHVTLYSALGQAVADGLIWWLPIVSEWCQGDVSTLICAMPSRDKRAARGALLRWPEVGVSTRASQP
jgi:hypothetical protein